MHRARTFALASCLLASTVSTAAAQLVVRVEARGFGLAGAEVAVWGETGRLASARTDGAGFARLTIDRGTAAGAFVTARRLGFAPARIALPARDSLTIALTEVAAPLPILAVEARPLRCPEAAEAGAESLWTAAAAHYGQRATRLHYGFRDVFVEEYVPRDQRGYGDGAEPRRQRMGWRSPVGSRDPLLMEPPPYGSYERHASLTGEHWQWGYSPLETMATSHFASAEFFTRHTFVVLGHSGDATLLGFCPRDREGPEIEGELQIGADTLFRAARWSFRVPHDDEDAGGEATFGLGRFEGAQYLVAVRGSFWRRARPGFYNQDRFERLAWRLGRSVNEANTGWTARGDLSTPPSAAPAPK